MWVYTSQVPRVGGGAVWLHLLISGGGAQPRRRKGGRGNSFSFPPPLTLSVPLSFCRTALPFIRLQQSSGCCCRYVCSGITEPYCPNLKTSSSPRPLCDFYWGRINLQTFNTYLGKSRQQSAFCPHGSPYRKPCRFETAALLVLDHFGQSIQDAVGITIIQYI